jgi:hypothetical protein
LGICSCELFSQFRNDFVCCLPIQRLAVPVFIILNSAQAFAFESAGEHDSRTIAGIAGLPISREQRRNVMSVDGQRLPAECLPAPPVCFQIVLEHRWLALSQSVDIDRRAQIA